MRNVALGALCVLSCGCYGITESVLNEIIDGYVEAYDPPPEAVTASRLAFVTSNDGLVVCFILDSGNSDPIIGVGETPTGIATGSSGHIYVTTDDTVRRMEDDWGGLDDLAVDAEVVGIDHIAAGSGVVVVAGRTDEGAVVLVYDDASGALVDTSAAVPDVTITSVAVADDVAFAVESSGEIVSYDLTTSPPAREPLAGDDATSGEPVAVVVGHTGNLFVASADTGDVQEIDIETGSTVRTLFAGGPSLRPVGMAFDPTMQHYLILTADDRVLELNRSGTLVETHVSDLVEGATAITFLGQ